MVMQIDKETNSNNQLTERNPFGFVSLDKKSKVYDTKLVCVDALQH